METIGIIPARYDSTRFPGKPLALIGNKSMIRRVYEQASKSKFLKNLYVATDDERIALHVLKFGGNVVITDKNISSGTERCLKAATLLKKESQKFNFIVNIQGDEPFIDPHLIDEVISALGENKNYIVSACSKIKNTDNIFNPNVVKTVFDKNHFALYFSRSPIPYVRNKEKNEWVKTGVFFKHIGIYAYSYNLLKKINSYTQVLYEIHESLEQLRWLYNGHKIFLVETNYENISVDTPEDLKLAEKYVKE